MTQTAAGPVWFSGICDVVLARVAAWYKHYEAGEVSRDQDYLTVAGEVIKKPTQYAHKIPWSLQELEHLERIVSTLRPNSPLAEEVSRVKGIWKKGILLAQGRRQITMMFYKEHVKQLLDILLEARSGKAAQKVDDIIEQKKKEGKDLFEM